MSVHYVFGCLRPSGRDNTRKRDACACLCYFSLSLPAFPSAEFNQHAASVESDLQRHKTNSVHPAKEGIDLGTKNYARPGVDANLTSHRIFDFFLLSKKWGYLLRPHFSQPRRECKSGFCNREWRHWGQPGAQVPFFSVNLSPSLICIRASLCVAAFYKLDGPQAGWEKIRSPPWCKQ